MVKFENNDISLIVEGFRTYIWKVADIGKL